jgi:hypothetical protein
MADNLAWMFATLKDNSSNWDWASNANATAYRSSMIALEAASKSTKAMDCLSNIANFASNTAAFASNNCPNVKEIMDATTPALAYASNMVAANYASWIYGSNSASHALALALNTSNIANRANTMAEHSWYRSAWASNLASHAMTYASSVVSGKSNWDWSSNAANYASNTASYTHKALENQLLLIAKLQQSIADVQKQLATTATSNA